MLQPARDLILRQTGHPQQTSAKPLVAIGGVGGSGTRLVAAIVRELGVDIGFDLNDALDNLTFTLLFKDVAIEALDDEGFARRAGILSRVMTGVPLASADRILVESLAEASRPSFGPQQHSREWLKERASRVVQAATGPRPGSWGWKEPNTHVVLPRLLRVFPGLRYVHVVRNGLDMALSRNQNQLRLWGSAWLGRSVEATPRDSLAYWCVVHRRIQEIGRNMGERFMWLDYDWLCAEPQEGVARIATFLSREIADPDTLHALVKPQETSGRGACHDLGNFDPRDLEYLRSIDHL